MKKFVQFLGEVKQEAKRVKWPSRKDIRNTTLVVLLSVMIFAIFFLAVDSFSYKIIKFFITLGV